MIWLLVAFLAGLVGWWSGQTVFAPPEDPLAQPDSVTYTVDEGVVGRILNFAAVAEWGVTPVARSEAQGIVTSVAASPGAMVTAGDTVFTVGLRPVVVAEGQIPAFREMALSSEGADVEQLQGLLATLGFFDSPPDGVFRGGTRVAVRDWQESLGITPDGVVRLGDVVFVPELPLRVAFDDQIAVGNRVAGGETVLVVADDPSFWIPLLPEQRSLVPLDAPVNVSYGGGIWEAVTVQATETVDQQGSTELRLVLDGEDGGSVCGSACADWVPLEGRTDFPAQVVVVPETAGPLVPVAAITTDPDGSTYVTLESGERVSVNLVASANGLAVVDGVGVGDVVLLPSDPGE